MNTTDVVVISDDGEYMEVVEVAEVVDVEEVEEVEKKTMEMVVLLPHNIKVMVKVDVDVNIGAGKMSCKMQLPLRRGDEIKRGIGEEVNFYLQLFSKRGDEGVPERH